MNDSEYVAKMKQIQALAQLALSVNAVELLPVIESMSSIGPLLDPTAFCQNPKAFDRLAGQKELAECVDKLAKVYARHLKIETGSDIALDVQRQFAEIGWRRLQG